MAGGAGGVSALGGINPNILSTVVGVASNVMGSNVGGVGGSNFNAVGGGLQQVLGQLGNQGLYANGNGYRPASYNAGYGNQGAQRAVVVIDANSGQVVQSTSEPTNYANQPPRILYVARGYNGQYQEVQGPSRPPSGNNYSNDALYLNPGYSR